MTDSSNAPRRRGRPPRRRGSLPGFDAPKDPLPGVVLPLVAHRELLRRAAEPMARLIIGDGYGNACVAIDDQEPRAARREPRVIWSGPTLTARSAVRLRLFKPDMLAGSVVRFVISDAGRLCLRALLEDERTSKRLMSELDGMLDDLGPRQTSRVPGPTLRPLKAWELVIIDLLRRAQAPVDPSILRGVQGRTGHLSRTLKDLRARGYDIRKEAGGYVLVGEDAFGASSGG